MSLSELRQQMRLAVTQKQVELDHQPAIESDLTLLHAVFLATAADVIISAVDDVKALYKDNNDDTTRTLSFVCSLSDIAQKSVDEAGTTYIELVKDQDLLVGQNDLSENDTVRRVQATQKLALHYKANEMLMSGEESRNRYTSRVSDAESVGLSYIPGFKAVARESYEAAAECLLKRAQTSCPAWQRPSLQRLQIAQAKTKPRPLLQTP